MDLLELSSSAIPVDVREPAASGVMLVEARHPRWAGRLHLRTATQRVVLTLNGSGGSFTREGDDLDIRWDRSAPERFRLRDGCFVHLDLLDDTPRTLEAPAAAQPPAEQPAPPPRVAIVTAYHKEPRALIERCMRSVRRQTLAADHILVADGHPQDWIEGAGVRHIRLDRSHGDYGNTPRGVGALLATSEGYDAIGFLDADNWLEPDHVQCGMAAGTAQAEPCDYAIARMILRRPDETILPVEGQPIEEHVDTNCFLFFPGSFHALTKFALMPRQLSPIGDRVFYTFLRTQDLRSAVLPVRTVNYHCIWESFYRAAGEAPPDEGKPNIDTRPIEQWIRDLSPRQRLHLNRRTGLEFH